MTVTVEGQYNADWFLLEGEQFVYPAERFLPAKRKKSRLWNAGHFLLFCLTIPLLPLFLLHGLLAYCGWFPLDTGENTTKGKKAIVIHANVITKKISGFSYSKREWKTLLLQLFYYHAIRIPVQEGQILLLSERKVEEGGNMELIRRELLRRKDAGERNTGYQIVEEFTPATIDQLSISAIRKIAKKIAVSPVIVLEDFYPQLHQIQLRQETRVIQLWHACGSFKTFGFSRLGKPGGASQSSPNHRSYWRAAVSGTKMIPIYGEAFGIPTNHVKALGVPRTDIFFQQEYRSRVREKLYGKYPQLVGKKIVLFAPTFRGDGNKNAYYPKEMFHPDLWMEHLPEDYAVIIKLHPFVKERISYDKKWKNRMVDLSDSENINDLLFITNRLVTDYSSVIFEATLLNVPMFFYAFDWQEYMRSRDIYGEYTSFVPGPIVTTEEKLIRQLQEKQNHNYQEYFRHSYLDALDGHSTERIAALIQECMKGVIQ